LASEAEKEAVPGVSSFVIQGKTLEHKSNLPVISPDFIQHALNSFLPKDELNEFVRACGRPLRKSIRVNTLKISVEDFLELAHSMGLKLSPIPWCKQGFWVQETTPDSAIEESESVVLGNRAEHLQGLYYIQEASSMLPPEALMSTQGQKYEDDFGYLNSELKILDLAAAPGSKTTQIAALMASTGLLLANELSASRVKSLHANLVRCGVSNTCLTQFDGRKLGERLAGVFDFVLLDAPCGGEGTVRKDPKALTSWELKKVQEISLLQKELILTAYRCLKAGGRLVYSTCTLSPEENQQVASYLLERTDAVNEDLSGLFDGANKATTDEGYLHILPHRFDSEGFFVAAFTKPEESLFESYDSSQDKWKTVFQPIDKKTEQLLERYYLSHFGFDISKLNGVFKQRDKEIWIFPEGYTQISQLVRLNRSGIKLAEVYPNKVRSSHEFSSCFAESVTKQKVEVSLQQAEDFYKGRNLEIERDDRQRHSLQDGEVILLFQNQPIGIGTLNKQKVKNQLPRDLVRDQIRFERP